MEYSREKTHNQLNATHSFMNGVKLRLQSTISSIQLHQLFLFKGAASSYKSKLIWWKQLIEWKESNWWIKLMRRSLNTPINHINQLFLMSWVVIDGCWRALPPWTARPWRNWLSCFLFSLWVGGYGRCSANAPQWKENEKRRKQRKQWMNQTIHNEWRREQTNEMNESIEWIELVAAEPEWSGKEKEI